MTGGSPVLDSIIITNKKASCRAGHECASVYSFVGGVPEDVCIFLLPGTIEGRGLPAWLELCPALMNIF